MDVRLFPLSFAANKPSLVIFWQDIENSANSIFPFGYSHCLNRDETETINTIRE